jgi:hypothetical protein
MKKAYNLTRGNNPKARYGDYRRSGVFCGGKQKKIVNNDVLMKNTK